MIRHELDTASIQAMLVDRSLNGIEGASTQKNTIVLVSRKAPVRTEKSKNINQFQISFGLKSHRKERPYPVQN